MVLTEMLTLNYPFYNYEKKDLIESVKKGILFDMPKREPVNTWVASCTKMEPQDRPSAHQMIEIIKNVSKNVK
jgi:hypothetical protein